MGARSVGLFLACLAIVPSVASAAAYTLDRHHLPTTVEGVPVDLYVSGPVDIDPALDHITGVFDVTIDLSDFQGKFERILDARAANAPCGQRVLVIRNGSLRPADTKGGVEAQITGLAAYATRSCKGSAVSSDESSRFRFRVTPAVESENIAFHVTSAAAGGETRDDICDAIVSAFGAVTHPSSVVAPLSDDTQALEPRVLAASFIRVDTGALGAKLRVELTVTPALLLEWMGAGR